MHSSAWLWCSPARPCGISFACFPSGLFDAVALCGRGYSGRAPTLPRLQSPCSAVSRQALPHHDVGRKSVRLSRSAHRLFLSVLLHSFALSLPDMAWAAGEAGGPIEARRYWLPFPVLSRARQRVVPAPSLMATLFRRSPRMRVGLGCHPTDAAHRPLNRSRGCRASGRRSQWAQRCLRYFLVPPRRGGRRWRLICSAREGGLYVPCDSRGQSPNRPAFVVTRSVNTIVVLGVAFRGPTERRIPVSSLNDLFPAPVLHCWRGIFFGDGDRAHGLVLR